MKSSLHVLLVASVFLLCGKIAGQEGGGDATGTPDIPSAREIARALAPEDGADRAPKRGTPIESAPEDSAEDDSADDHSPEPVKEAPEDPASHPRYVPNAAGLALFRTLADHPEFVPDDGNLVLSPANLEPILLALETGARGRTARELESLLCPGGSTHAIPYRPWQEDKEDQVGESRSFAAWIAEQYRPEPAFLNTLGERLGMTAHQAAFARNAAGETQQINDWIRESTSGRIPGLFGEGELDERTRLVIASALAYEGSWTTPFETRLTKPGTFLAGLTGEKVETDFMHRVGEYACREFDGIRVLSLPLGTTERCVLLLPSPGASPYESLRTLEQTLDTERYRTLTSDLEFRTVDLKLPRVGLKVRSSIKAGLQLLGAGSLFSPGLAELSGISDEPGLCVDILRHEIEFEWDEEGARGTAATAASVAARGWPRKPVDWTFDRPFVFVVESIRTGELLFVGRFVQPSSTLPSQSEP